MKRVSFSSSEPKTYIYDAEPNENTTFNSCQRRYLESRLISNPDTEMSKLQNLFDSFRKFDVTLVFGNLGRQPELLHFFLRLCFPASVKICVSFPKYFKGLSNSYPVTDGSPFDFLFIVEPEFGYTILKPERVHHVVVLTSHLILNTPGNNEQDKLLHLGSTNLDEGLTKRTRTWKSPLFCSQQDMCIQGQFQLDVSSCKTAHEAYLRLLTGRQLLRYRQLPVIARTSLIRILKSFIERSRLNVQSHFNQDYLEFWYFDILQKPGPNPFDFILKCNLLRGNK